MVTELFEDYEGNREDAGQLKKDNWQHARTSFESLKRFANTMAATPVDTVKRKEIQKKLRDPYQRAPNKAQYWPQPNLRARRELDAMRSWLLSHSHELERELEDEEGRMKQGRTYYEVNEAALRDPYKDIAAQRGGSDETRTFRVADQSWDGDDDVVSKYEAHGLFHVERLGSNEPLLNIGREIDKANPTSHATRILALRVRGERYRKLAERQAKRLRWRGMEEYDAVEKANEKLREGVARSKDSSNAKPLPDLGRLHELFRLSGSDLIRRVGGRGYKEGDTVNGRLVRVDGDQFVTSRIAYALATGEDPADKMVRNGTASHYRKAEGHAAQRGDGNWDALVQLGKDLVTVGEYQTETQAKEACRLYLKSLDMGL